MKLPHFKKKYFAGAAAAGLAMGAGGFAAAYFTATGSGTGQASVGHATPFTVTQTSRTTDLYPGTSQTVNFTIHNAGQGIQHWSINSTQITLATTSTDIVTANTGKGVTGCLASWFTASVPANLGGNLGPGDNSSFPVTVSMSNGTGATGSTQDACETTFPLLTVAFSGPVHGFALYSLTNSTANWTNPGKANEAAVLTLGTGGVGAGIELLKPPSTLPTTAPTFTTNNYNAGSPRWYILFATGKSVEGYPTNSGLGTSNWSQTNSGSYVPWSTIMTNDGSRTVKAVDVIMDADQTPPSTSTITNLLYGSKSF